MASTAAALKYGALLLTVCAVLLHSSSGQQQPVQPSAPAPAPLDCSNCSRICTMRCQAMADARGRYCSTMITGASDVYDSCFQAITTHTCNSNSYIALGTCTIGWCSAKFCSSLCARGACESCTIAAHDAYISCMAYQGTIMQSCMPDCTSNCVSA